MSEEKSQTLYSADFVRPASAESVARAEQREEEEAVNDYNKL